jgi:hypothetical protein
VVQPAPQRALRVPRNAASGQLHASGSAVCYRTEFWNTRAGDRNFAGDHSQLHRVRSAGEASNIRLFGDPAGPTPVTINGNTSIGVNTFGGHVTMFGPVQVLNNGAGGGSFHAGVRSDDNALVVVAGSGDVDISNNTGPGIEATNGGTLDLAGATIYNNTEDGVRLLGNSQIAVYPPNTNAIGNNGGRAILCDNTSNFFGDRTGLRDLLCQISQLTGRAARSWMGTGLQDEKPAPYIRSGKH